jgi:single-stranded-DNA-specific exonuclease
LAFGMADQFPAIKKADSFEACFQINENIFRGNRTLQLMLKDIRITNDV